MKTSLPTALVVALMVACSGGGGSDNGGIGGTGFSQGVVTDLGSARVTGTLWEFDASTEYPNGSDTDLQLGQVVLIEGTLGSTNLATRVVFDDIIVGPLDANPVEIDPVGAGLREFMILDRRIVMSVDTTEFAGGATFLGLLQDDNIQVSGFEGPDGITATRIEFVNTSNDVEFRGTVDNVDLIGGSFEIGDVDVNILAGTTFTGFGGTTLMDGDYVEVDGTIVDTLEVDADDIELRSQGVEDVGDLDDVEIEGLVTDFVSLGSFRVAGQLVSTLVVGVQFEPTNPSFIQNGARIEVEGDIRDGVLLADEVKLREQEVRVKAAIASAADVSVVAGTFTLAGIDFSIDSATRFEDVADLSGIAACIFLETRGILIVDVVRATLIKCKDETDAVEIRARVEAFDATAGTFDLLGIAIDTGLASFEGFPGVVNEAQFYLFLAANPNELVEAQDQDDGDATTFGVADEVEREEPDDS